VEGDHEMRSTEKWFRLIMQAVKKTLEWRFLSEDLTIFHKHFGKETRSLVPDIWWKIGIGINLASHLKIW